MCVRRAEIGLADAEIDDVAALGRELGRARQHGERVLLADAIEGGNGTQHGRSLLGLLMIDFAPTLGA